MNFKNKLNKILNEAEEPDSSVYPMESIKFLTELLLIVQKNILAEIEKIRNEYQIISMETDEIDWVDEKFYGKFKPIIDIAETTGIYVYIAFDDRRSECTFVISRKPLTNVNFDNPLDDMENSVDGDVTMLYGRYNPVIPRIEMLLWYLSRVETINRVNGTDSSRVGLSWAVDILVECKEFMSEEAWAKFELISRSEDEL